jgi:hypothetical protein
MTLLATPINLKGRWLDEGGNAYVVLHVANVGSLSTKYPVDMVYKGFSGCLL